MYTESIKLNHKGTIELTTDRLLLRRFRIEDVDPMHQNWATDENVTRYLFWKPHQNKEVTISVIQSWIDQYINDDFYQWAVCLKDQKHEPIGSLSIFRINESIRSGDIGYCIGQDWWGQGILAEGLNKVIDFMFQDVNMNRIVGLHHPDNPNSGKVMKKCGLQKEGHLRQVAYDNQGNLVDMICYSRLASD